MSVVIFDKEEELRKSLLPAQSGFEGGVGDQPRQQGPGYGLEPSTEGSLEAGTSTTSLDSSRKTLNQAAAVDQRRERDFEGGLIVELSKTESKISRSRGLSSSSMEDNDSEEISGGEEEGHRPLFAINYTFLDHARSPSGAYSTLPRPFNPSESSSPNQKLNKDELGD